ncbi:MAG: magnesium transporter [Candidatus Marinimicrobia bacterium]|nr:magnesium transporter [Candidatus Neomarinimicrobiota bacterium]MBL7023162.1 magnesium transporter [Candidatus Neomarinimicrobiota bacterium]MBL7109030.1 magnesium transporter [Candidatus Neomarinimicrobiota bacterium]
MRKQLSENEVGLILKTLQRLYRRNASVAMYKLVYKTHPADMAWVYRHLNSIERKDIFQFIERMEGLGDFLNELDDAIIIELFGSLSPNHIAEVLGNIDADDIVGILDVLPNETSTEIRELLNLEERKEVEELLQYDDESAGRIMSTHFVAFQEILTVQEAIVKFQELKNKDTDAPFYIYVINEKNQMAGVLSLRQLLLNKPKTALKDIIDDDFIAVSPDTDQEEVAKLVSQYNYLALPVVEKNNELVGVITVDDVIDILREEATEDILKMAGAGQDREILLKSTFDNAKTRFPWLMASWIGGVIALMIIGAFETLLEKTVALVAFIPVIIGMGGNVGTQTSTIIVRGIATGRVNVNEVYKIIFKEIRVGMLLGIIYGAFLGVLAYFRFVDFTSPVELGFIVGISIFFAMTIACTIGSLFPIVLDKLNFDPAISTGPFVTTAIDIVGVLIYFYIATFFLGFK